MEDIIQLQDRKFKIMIKAEKIDQAGEAVAQRINADYAGKETPLFLGILNGSFMFMSDLIKKIEFQNELSFVKLASYDGTCSTGCVKSLIGLNNSIEGRHVIIVEDIVDTGESIEHMIKELEARNPASVEVCTLFFKPGSYRKTLPIKYRAMEIIDELEAADRGIYGGTVGYFDFSGNMDMAIAIRTAFLRDHQASVQAGAGLVLDSVPATEWQETRSKAEASVEAIQIAAQLRSVE